MKRMGRKSKQNNVFLFSHVLIICCIWFKFILGLMFFELVSILLAFVPDYGNEYTTKENKN